MNTTEWFVGSASRSIDPDARERTNHAAFAGIASPLMVHAVGFRGEDCLLAIVVCDVGEPSHIDLSSLRFHINLHPITPVEVIIVASGVCPAPAYTATSATYQHHVVHAITDCVIDALTFGCPAVMRVTPDFIQWRKFDELPIATMSFHQAGTRLERADYATLEQHCHAPVLCVTHARAVHQEPLALRIDELGRAPKQAVTQVRWQHDAPHWVVTVNEVSIQFGAAQGTPGTGTYVIAREPNEPAR
jgi:hypothetical protein